MSEKIYFKNAAERILVTDKRFVVKETTYPIRQISSVAAHKELHKNSRVLLAHPKVQLVTGGLVGGSIILGLLGNVIDALGELAGILFVASIFTFLLTIILRWTIEYHLYSVTIDVASGRAQAYVSNDPHLIYKITKAIEHALIST